MEAVWKTNAFGAAVNETLGTTRLRRYAHDSGCEKEIDTIGFGVGGTVVCPAESTNQHQVDTGNLRPRYVLGLRVGELITHEYGQEWYEDCLLLSRIHRDYRHCNSLEV